LLRWRRSGPLLVPLIELLLLLLFLLRAALLHRRRGANQRMRFLRTRSDVRALGLPEIAFGRLGVAIFLRLHIPVLRLLHVPASGLRHVPVLGLRSSLLLVDSRLRLRHLPYLIVADVGLTEWPEAILGRHGPSHLVGCGRLRGSYGTDQ
jgi:hypothetical protein